MKVGGSYFALYATLWWNISENLQLISILPPRNRTAELQAGRQTTKKITVTQAVASKSIASAERIKNQLFIGPFLSVFVLLINVLFSNNFRKSSRNIRHFRAQQSQKRPAKSWRD
jgi:hypothetical protein